MKSKFDKQMWEDGKSSGSTAKFPRNNVIDEEAPYTEKMSQRYPRYDKESNWDGKYVAKFLKSRIGHSWDSIYSEVSHAINKNSWTGHNLIDCLNWMVHKNVYFVDGVAYNTDGKRIFYGWHRAIFYVDNNGLLQVKEDKRQRYNYRNKPEITLYEVDNKHFIYRNDIWYRATMEVPTIVRTYNETLVSPYGWSHTTKFLWLNMYDILSPAYNSGHIYREGDLEKQYGRLVCCRRLEAANKKEIKKVKEKYKLS
jgi:hypothetical protein